MKIGVGVSLAALAVLGGDAGVGLGVGTALQRILALSPSLLIWPEQGAGWQGTSGGTLAASGQPLGLGVDLSQLGGKTLAEWLAAPTTSQLVSNGSFASDTAWTKGAGWTISGGKAQNSGSIGGLTQIILTVGRVYVCTFTVDAVSNWVVGPNGISYTVPGTYTAVFNATGTSLRFDTQVGGHTCTIDNVSCYELPGNHLRAGTWASPSDAARGTFQNNAISFDGASDYYSLLSAISITESMTVVSAFKRAAAASRQHFLNNSGSVDPAMATWSVDNNVYLGIGASSATAQTSQTATGSFVFTARRNASNQWLRRNGSQVFTGSAPTVSGTLDNLGKRNTLFTSGEQSFHIVVNETVNPLTDADIALIEQIAASTNGAVLA